MNDTVLLDWLEKAWTDSGYCPISYVFWDKCGFIPNLDGSHRSDMSLREAIKEAMLADLDEEADD